MWAADVASKMDPGQQMIFDLSQHNLAQVWCLAKFKLKNAYFWAS